LGYNDTLLPTLQSVAAGNYAMTPEEEVRIRELPKLIADSKDPDTVKALAAELVRLLTLPDRRATCS
jgi:hypothetical protein